MQSATLANRLILIVDDEPIIAIDLIQIFESAGARVLYASSVRDALAISEEVKLAAAVVDHVLVDGRATELCVRLKERDVPFLIYTGYPVLEGYSDAVLVPKPALPQYLLTRVVALISAGSDRGAGE